jgi:hypothetical protein
MACGMRRRSWFCTDPVRVRTPAAFWARTSIPPASQHATTIPINFTECEFMMPPDRLHKMMPRSTGRRITAREQGHLPMKQLTAIRKEVGREGLRILKVREKEGLVKPAETIEPARTTPAAQAHPQAANCRCDAVPIDRGRYRNADAHPDQPRPTRGGLPTQPQTEPMPATRRPTPAAAPFSEDGGRTVLSAYCSLVVICNKQRVSCQSPLLRAFRFSIRTPRATICAVPPC